MRGKLGVLARASGTRAAPRLELRARLEGASDLDLTLEYDGAVARFAADAKQQLALDAEVRVRAPDLLAGGTVPWTGRLDAKLAGLPLDHLLARLGVRGNAGGTIHLERTSDAVRGGGRIDVDELSMYDATFGAAALEFQVDENAANVSAEVRGADGRVDGTLAWRRGAAITARIDASNLPLRFLEQFIPVVDELEGSVDARITATIHKRADGRYEGSPVGTIAVRDAVVVVEALGERWDHVNTELRLENHRLELPPLELVGRSGGRVRVAGFATLAGGFHVRIDADRAPFAQARVKVGTVTGITEIDGKLVPLADGRHRLVIDVTLERLSIDLGPSAEKPTQALDEDRSIVTRQALGPRVTPAGVPGVGMPVTVAVHVRDPVLVRRSDVHIAVIGNPKIEIDGLASLGGELRIVGDAASPLIQPSWVEAAGKRFYLRESNLALGGRDNFDPTINVDVRWLAPDRTIVQVRITGHLRAPHIAFNALDVTGAPIALTRGQIMSLLALGRRDPGSIVIQSAAESGAGLYVASIVSDVTGALLGKEMQKWLPAEVSVPFVPAKQATGHDLESLYLEFASNTAGVRLGSQPLGQTTPRSSFAIEWRYRRMLSLITTIGDTGSVLVAFVWQYRY
jgi:hypothetical protein